MKKKIMHLTFSLNIGGLETLLLSFLQNIDRNEFTPMVCTLSGHGALTDEFKRNGIEIITLKKKKGIDFKLITQLAKILKTHQVDIIHTHNFGAWLYGAAAGLLAKVPVINTEHSNVPLEEKLQMFAEKKLASLSRYIICDSRAVEQHLNQVQKIPQNKLKLILNGVDLKLFQPIAENGRLKQELGIEPNTVVLGSIARLDEVKNHIGLLKGIKLLQEQQDNFRLLIVGDGETRSELENYVSSNQLSNHVTFLGNRRDISNILSIVDIFVLNSFAEGLPIALLEAMASSKPSVVSDVGGNSEILGTDSQAGIVLGENNEKELSQALASLIENPLQRKSLGETARKRVEEKASLQKMVNEYENLYRICAA